MKILFFTQESCIPCRRLKPVMKQLAEEYDLDIDELDVQRFRKVSNEFQVIMTPTLVVLDDDGLELRRVTGAKPKRDMIEALELEGSPVVEEQKVPKGILTTAQMKAQGGLK